MLHHPGGQLGVIKAATRIGMSCTGAHLGRGRMDRAAGDDAPPDPRRRWRAAPKSSGSTPTTKAKGCASKLRRCSAVSPRAAPRARGLRSTRPVALARTMDDIRAAGRRRLRRRWLARQRCADLARRIHVGHGCVIDPVRGRRTGIGLVGLGTSRTRADLWRRQRLRDTLRGGLRPARRSRPHSPPLVDGVGASGTGAWRARPSCGRALPRDARCRTGRRCDAVGLLAPLHVAALVRG